MVIHDLTKRCNELSNRLKEFSALYEVVKNERNKYVNLIQSSSQALAEMREKIRILVNEVGQVVPAPPAQLLCLKCAAVRTGGHPEQRARREGHRPRQGEERAPAGPEPARRAQTGQGYPALPPCLSVCLRTGEDIYCKV